MGRTTEIETSTETTIEVIKTSIHGNMRMIVTMKDGDIHKLMFHRKRVGEEGGKTSGTNWQHLFSLKSHQMFSYSEVKELLFSFTKLCYIARDLLISLGG